MRKSYWLTLACLLLTFRATAATIALTGGTVYRSPSDPPIARGVVIVTDGKIAAVGGPATPIPAGSKRIDCRNSVVTAGFWNSHVHFVQQKWSNAATSPANELGDEMREMLTRYGFTSVFDVGSYLANTLALRRRIEAGEFAGPRILTTGEIIFPRGGKPADAVMGALGFIVGPMPEVATPEEGRAAAQQILDGGADAVKIYAATWAGPHIVMPQPIVAAIAEEAHRRDKLLLAHPSDGNGMKSAIDGGADILVHTAPNAGRWSADLIATLMKKNIAVIPTLKLFKYEARHGRQAWAKPFIDAGVDQLRAFAAAGGTVLFGTDVGYMEDYDTADEYRLMAKAGLTFRQILATLTTAPAQRFGFDASSGRIAAGYDGDLVVVPAAAVHDPARLANVRTTIRRGAIVFSNPAF